MNGSRLLLLTILLGSTSLHANTAVAATYYIDSQGGNDRNIHHNYSEGNAGFLEASWAADYKPRAQKVYNLRVAIMANPLFNPSILYSPMPGATTPGHRTIIGTRTPPS